MNLAEFVGATHSSTVSSWIQWPVDTLRKTNSSHLKMWQSKRKLVSKPSIYRDSVSFREGKFLLKNPKPPLAFKILNENFHLESFRYVSFSRRLPLLASIFFCGSSKTSQPADLSNWIPSPACDPLTPRWPLSFRFVFFFMETWDARQATWETSGIVWRRKKTEDEVMEFLRDQFNQPSPTIALTHQK